uniref:Solute carrier family 19 member 2 n=1 Tax=Labrus bergylta TaxID=56723 RepID=A0A3Q3FBI7_9LABR
SSLIIRKSMLLFIISAHQQVDRRRSLWSVCWQDLLSCERDLSIWTYSYLALLFPIFLARTTLRHYVMLLKAQGMLACGYYSYITLLLSVAKLSCCTRHHQLTAAAWPSSSLLVSAMPKRSLFFHKSPGSAEEGQKGGIFKMIFLILSLQDSSETERPRRGLLDVLRMLFDDFLQCYSSSIARLRDLQRIRGDHKCLCTSSGALAALLVGYLPVSWSLWGAGSVCHVLLMAVCVFVMDIAAYMLLITVATSQQFNMQRYALVFGVNTFMALLLQTLLTLVVVDSVGFGLDVFTQFLLYGGYFTLIAVVFLLAGLCKLVSRRRSEEEVLGNGSAETGSDSPPISDT